jgi:hypothetical protein
MKSIIAVSIFLVSVLHADWKRIIGSSDTPVPPDKKVMKSDTLGVYIRTTVFGFTEEDTTIDSKEFIRVGIPEELLQHAYDDTTMAGKPQMPCVRLLIAVPDSASFSTTICADDYTLFEDFLVYPTPRIIFEDTADCAYYKEVYTYDTSLYEKDTIYPGKLYEIVKDGYWRDQRVLDVCLYPVQFNPKQKLLYFYAGLDLRIDYSGTVAENDNGLGPYEEVGREVLLNYAGVDKEPESQVPPSVHFYTNLDTSNVADYVIVTHEDFSTNDDALEQIEELAEWRVDHNKFEVGIVEIQDVYSEFPDSAPDSAAQLREFLVYVYDHWSAPAMPDGHFGYCLLVGDWDYVPTKLNVSIHGDRFYDAFEGYFRDIASGSRDWFDDIMVGRWPVKETHVDDLVTICQKTINYEKYPATTNWRRRGLLIAGPNGPGEGLLANGLPCFTDIGYDTFTVRWNEFDTAHVDPETLFLDTIHTLLDSGEILAAWYGHGWFNYWTGEPWTTGYSTTYADTLQNDSLLPVVFGYACVSGSFQWDHPYYRRYSSLPDSLRISLGESFLFNPDGGAVAYYGGASPLYMDSYTTIPMERMLRYQHWILGQALINAYPWQPYNSIHNCYCLLGDPALDLGDYTAYPNLPDLVVRPQGVDIRLLPTAPYCNSGDSVPIRVKILNIGGAKASNIDVRFEIYCNESKMYDDTVAISKIQPRDSAIVTSYWHTGTTHPSFYGEIGDCEFRVTVDPFGEIAESWEANNQSAAIQKIALYPYKSGWPKEVVGFSQPAIANLNNADSVEIVHAGVDSIYVYKPDGSICSGWPQYFNKVQAVVLADLNCAGNMEIIAVSAESVTVYDYQGNIVSGWPQCIPDTSKQFHGFPAVGYIAGTSERQVVLYVGGKEPDDLPGLEPVQSAIMVYDHDGDSLCYLTHRLMDAFNPYSSNGATISDVNNDAKDEIVVSYEYHKEADDSCFTEIFNRDGHVRTLKWGSRLSTPALVDLSGDDVEDMVITSAIDDTIRTYDAVNDTVLWKRATYRSVNSSPAVGNIHPTEEGVEVTFGNDTSEVYLLRGPTGVPIDPWPFVIEDTTLVRTAAAIADINGDGDLNIIIGDNRNYIYGFKHTRVSVSPFPLPLFGKPSSPIIGDIDGDSKSEIIISSADGFLHVWENRDSSVRSNSLEWPQFHHDHQRTGLYGW